MSFFVSTSELVATKAKVAELNKRAAKAGIAAVVTVNVIGSKTVTETTESGFDRTYQVHEAELVGIADVKLGDWTLAATINHDPAGNVVSSVPNFPVEIPVEYWATSASRCDHCNAVRNRIDTVLVWSEAEGFKQVGSDCVKLFLGVSPSSLIAWAREARELDEERYGGGWSGGPSVSEFVAAAAVVTEVYGFAPSSFDASTKGIALDWVCLTGQYASKFRNDNPRLFEDSKAVERGNELATAAIAWVATQTTDNDYIRNLKIAAARSDLGNNAGLLASLPNAYKRYLGQVAEREAKAALPASEYVGADGGKVTVKAKVVYTNRSAGYSYYGPDSLFIILLTDKGEKIWVKTTVETAVGVLLEDADKDQYFTVTGTVKAHKLDNKDSKVTVLTRCKAVEA
jgi:hypothetical protein